MLKKLGTPENYNKTGQNRNKVIGNIYPWENIQKVTSFHCSSSGLFKE